MLCYLIIIVTELGINIELKFLNLINSKCIQKLEARELLLSSFLALVPRVPALKIRLPTTKVSQILITRLARYWRKRRMWY